MRLIENVIPGKWKVIRESNSNGVQKIRLTGTAGKVNEVNRNKRIYPREILESAIGSLTEKIANRELIGALDHPTNTSNMLSQASHLITKLWMDKNDVLWEAEILPTPAGNILKNLIDADVRVGISSRGEGNLTPNEDGTSTVSEYKLVTFDIVADPSTYGAYASLSESVANTEKVNDIIKHTQGTQVFLTLLKNKIDDVIEAYDPSKAAPWLIKKMKQAEKGTPIKRRETQKGRNEIAKKNQRNGGSAHFDPKDRYKKSNSDNEDAIQNAAEDKQIRRNFPESIEPALDALIERIQANKDKKNDRIVAYGKMRRNLPRSARPDLDPEIKQEERKRNKVFTTSPRPPKLP